MERQRTQTQNAAGAQQLRWRLQHADLPAVAEMRKALRERLRHSGVPGLSDTAELLATELVTNVLQYTGHGAVLTVTLYSSAGSAAHHLRVEVRDFAPHQALRPCAPGESATHGRGLLLVQALTDAWGVHSDSAGKVVWFELAVPPV
jgi:anti-sigma regulatory factor (Ser/Thr protein kinase)